jgi:hypothetical protein
MRQEQGGRETEGVDATCLRDTCRGYHSNQPPEPLFPQGSNQEEVIKGKKMKGVSLPSVSAGWGVHCCISS